ncbi:uncharacterized protein N7477_002816 [Penicillium maclennaniae]|uniref:uncharacterized protein n=1 Tax=Penicillium maclennaniae TaxID=1343394 RepID=UPI0025415C47|nr:uncharacterized protein N7477_002816 [Penicillium maclennaniae]KAJ5677183.1 hypothetical protein N7477_002816 [Penicillium maclennaniae]
MRRRRKPTRTPNWPKRLSCHSIWPRKKIFYAECSDPPSLCKVWLALQIPVANGGFMRRGGVPLGGGDAVEAFLEGVRQHVKEDSGAMETD